MNRKFFIFALIFCMALGVLYFLENSSSLISKVGKGSMGKVANEIKPVPFPLSIEALKAGKYPGSDLAIEQTLDPGSNYHRYVASYKSEGLKIYGLLTIPDGIPPAGGWPAIIFNHGFIPPGEYQTTERYVAYQDAFASRGYVTFKSDYRGHGKSGGVARGGYGSNDYTIDVLNATSSVKRLKDVNKNKIGMWGHSMGGFLTLRALVVDPSIKVAVIWGGVVADYNDLLYNWHRSPATAAEVPRSSTTWRKGLLGQFGTPKENPDFWNSLSANSYLKDVSTPIQLDHSTTDEEVPVQFSRDLYQHLKSLGKTVQFYEYAGDDHNISANFNLAAQRSVDFFDKYLK
jgi:dipeptidyl aminopeptidase/acylaminoacyl peptidase